MQTISNPFAKPNPFKNSQLTNKYQHAHFPSKPNPSYNPHIFKQYPHAQLNNYVQNNWSFHDNNANKINITKQLANRPTISDFSIVLKTNNLANKVKYGISSEQNRQTARRDRQREKQRQRQNPFYRKNLLINKQQVANMVQLDLSQYRNKARSTYQVNASSHYVYQQSPVNNHNHNAHYNLNLTKQVSFGIKQRSRRSSQSNRDRQYDYVKQKEYTNNRQMQESNYNNKVDKVNQQEGNPQDLLTIKVKGKTFYLANLD